MDLISQILVKKQIIEKSSELELPKPFILIALLPITSSRVNIPNQLVKNHHLLFINHIITIIIITIIINIIIVYNFFKDGQVFY